MSTLFTFASVAGESIGARIVRCCTTALKDGPMGKSVRRDFYRDFIACNQEKTLKDAEALAAVDFSTCAMFVRAVRQWCGAPPSGPYVPGTTMFTSIGKVNFAHPSFVKCVAGGPGPNPGDYFYLASSPDTKGDGHTGIFVSKSADGSWQTAEGGGPPPPDRTTCRFRTRTIDGTKFKANPNEIYDGRTLYGWFDCTKVGLPVS